MATVKTRSGRVLTDEQVEQIAQQMEAGAFRLGRGRPPLGPDRPSPRVQIRIPAPLYSALNERATKEGKTVSKVVRDAVEAYLR